MTIKSGDQYVAYADRRPAERLYVTISRVAKDKTWADIRVQTWAVMWTKRQKLKNGVPPECVKARWGEAELVAQQDDHMAKFGRAT